MSPLPSRTPLGGWRTLTTGAAVGLAAVFMVALVGAAGSARLGFDFRAAYLPAAEAVREGSSPYASPGTIADATWHPYQYPPQLAIALIPLTFLPADVAAFLAFLASLCAVVATLALAGVRDIRCFAVVLIWPPTWHALEMANVSAVLALALVLVWRYRDRDWGCGATLGLATSVKLFLWPMAVWALATGRLRAAGAAIAIGVSVTLVAWAAIGFEGLSAYPDLVASLGDQTTYSIVAVTEELGYTQAVGDVLAALVGSALLGLVVYLGRNGDELRAFGCAIAATLALTPVLWLHYLVLLVVPLGLIRPRFSAIWLLPIALWMCPRPGNGEGLQPVLPLLVATVIFVVLLARPAPSPLAAEVSS